LSECHLLASLPHGDSNSAFLWISGRVNGFSLRDMMPGV
jgi:hypothetical protein